MTIRILSNDIINKIAAGEVIENPASVVKELIENAIDAGATRIDIITKNGGKAYISVQDNGFGMNKEDLSLCIQRHATSKLKTNNLFDISSLGFRGEALPSIASVSKIKITTNDGNECWQYENDEISPSTLQKGTRIEISDLFFKIPARLKFLKSDNSENSNIISVIQNLSLSKPDITFTFNDTIKFLSLKDESKEKQLFHRCQEVFGKEFTEDKVLNINSETDCDFGKIKLYGYISKPVYNKSSSIYQHCFVNGRPVKDKLLSVAIRIAYTDVLERGRYPLTAIFLDVPKEFLDVNVHPAKYEVRFKNGNLIREFIIHELKKSIAISSNKIINTLNINDIIKPSSNNIDLNNNFQKPLNFISENYLSDTLSKSISSINITNFDNYISTNNLENIASNSLGFAIAQIDNKYIISIVPDGIIITDQHACHERILYEKFKSQMNKTGVERQILLIPEIVNLNEADKNILLEHKEDFEKMGLVFDEFSNDSISVSETPSICGELDIQGLIKQIIDEIKDFEKAKSLDDKINYILKTYACHTSIRAGKSLTIEEMNELLKQIIETENGSHCNHGRPTYIKLKTSDMDKLFHR